MLIGWNFLQDTLNPPVEDLAPTEVIDTTVYKNKEMVYLTDEMRAYNIDDENIFIKLKRGGRSRFVHGEPLVLEEDEAKQWKGFLKYIEENNLEPLPEKYTDKERLGFKFLTGLLFNYKATHTSIIKREKFYIPTKFDEKYQKWFDAGAIYVSGRITKKGYGYQPVINLNIKAMADLKPTPEELIEMLTFYYTWIINNMMIPGHIENWLIIVELKTSISWTFL